MNITIAGESNIDEIDRTLILLLLDDVKMTNRQLAAHAGISVSAVSTRLRRLTETGAVVFTAIIDWEKAGFDWFTIARIRTQERSPRDVAEDIGNLRQCYISAVSLGRHDVIAYFLVEDRDELKRLTNEVLPDIGGIADLHVDLATDTSITANGRQMFLVRGAPILRLPSPQLELDELDISIIQALVDDGRQSSRKIAHKHCVSEGTIRTRLNRLTQASLVRVVAMVEPVTLGMGGAIASISIQVDRSRVAAVRGKLAGIPEITFIAVCVGSSDLNIGLIASAPQALIELVSTQVQTIPGVQATEILFMIDVIRFSPYMKRLNNDGS